MAGWYVVTVPSLPGCITQGKTIKEAKENIKEAISLYLEPEEEIIPGKGKRRVVPAIHPVLHSIGVRCKKNLWNIKNRPFPVPQTLAHLNYDLPTNRE